MAKYAKDSRASVLSKEAPKVTAFLEAEGLTPTEGNVARYYETKGEKVTKNAVKVMVKYLNKEQS